MKLLIDLDENTIRYFQQKANQELRSRKQYLEYILTKMAQDKK